MPAEETQQNSKISEEAPTNAASNALNEDVMKDSAKTVDNEVKGESIDLHTGKALTAQEAYRITAARQVQLLMIAGAVGSGKTTLIASIFHCFQRGPFANYLFAGSDTLLGFDQRCYLARTASGRSTADTDRTIPGTEHLLLHLRIRASNLSSPAKDVLISDLSGEHFEAAKDSVSECRCLSLIQRADHFILLVDGEKLVEPERRQGAKNEAVMLLRSCLDAGQLGQRSLVDVLFSKWDLVDTSENKPENLAFVENVEVSIKEQFEPHVGRLRFFKVAARRAKGDFPIGYGLAKPFVSWVSDTSDKTLPTNIKLHEPSGISEFDRYFKRTLPLLFTKEG